MKKLIIFLLPFSMIAQSEFVEIVRGNEEVSKSSFRIVDDYSVSAMDFFINHSDAFGLLEHSSMKLTRINSENNGLKHYRFKQYYKDIEVYGADYILHEKNNQLLNGNGLIFSIDKMSVDSKIREDELLSYCLNELSLSKEELTIHSNKLVIINRNYPSSDGELILAYVVELHISKGNSDDRKLIIDAKSGELILNFSILTNCFTDKGKVETLYHKEHDIDAEKIDSNYVTHDYSRGGGIYVSNNRNEVYKDTDNHWEKGTEDFKHGVHDLFWGLQKTYDYYKNRFGRQGADDQKLPIKAFLLDDQKWVNATWSQTLLQLNFGIGDNANFSPLTSLDVVGHEFTHGVTQFSAGLEYLYEAGAMNEAFSDIIGKAIEHEFDQDSFSWYMGGRFAKTKALAFRSMENPNAYQCPKYYKGIQWKTGSADNGGVHYNSGVLNYWFYLLCTGKDTVNEAKIKYSVRKLGIDSASLFAYTLLNNYLGKTSTYYDAREASLLLASNWWGSCSEDYLNISEAWKAVGVGTSVLDNDIQLININSIPSACKDGNYTIASRINNLSCSKEIPSGSQIILYYKFDTFPTYSETFNLTTALSPNSHQDYYFKVNPKIVKAGQSRLTVWMESMFDSDTANNRYSFLINKISTSTDHDFRINTFNVIGAICPGSETPFKASANCTYNGCTVIPPGNVLKLLLEFNDSISTHEFITKTSTYPQGSIFINDIPIPRSFLGIKKVKVSLVWPKDTVFTNNSVNSQIIMVDYRFQNEIERFDNFRYDSIKLAIRSDSFNTSGILRIDEFDSDALSITGGTVLRPNGSFIPFNESDPNSMFNRNTKYTTEVFICADVSNISNPMLEFDLGQRIGTFKYDSVNLRLPSSPASTRINYYNSKNELIDQLFIFEGLKNLTKVHHAYPIPLSTHYIEITHLVLNGGLDSVGFPDQNGDLVIMDNIVITGLTSVQNQRNGINEIILYPNPSQAWVNVRCTNPQDKILKFKLYNSLGQVLYEVDRIEQESSRIFVNDPGNYYLEVFTSSSEVIRKCFNIIK
ncbi:MAG: M4 family metallopeptidase [Saprospiraceae bacterium]|nr:M4 family metallopeptidase [Saprospiraceae bacterium]